jgi:hypothetical protein
VEGNGFGLICVTVLAFFLKNYEKSKKASGYSDTTLCHCITHKVIGDVSTEHVWVLVRSVIHITNVNNKIFSDCRVMLAR